MMIFSDKKYEQYKKLMKAGDSADIPVQNMNVKIKIESEAHVIIGDIWTKVDIQFKPMVHDNGISGQIMIDSFNNRLDGLAGELEVQIRKWLEEKFKDD